MPARKRTTLRVKVAKDSVFRVSRPKMPDPKLVYIACANRAIRYRFGRSRILYIGSTFRGLTRIAETAVARANHFFSEWGVSKVYFYPVYPEGRKRVASWKELERALILRFRELHGDVPLTNQQFGKSMTAKGSKYFSSQELDRVLTSVVSPAKPKKRSRTTKRK